MTIKQNRMARYRGDYRSRDSCELDSERFETAADRVFSELLDCEQMIRHRLKIEEEVASDRMIQHFGEHKKQQATADVLLNYGLGSLFEPMRIRKRRRQRAIDD
jgi:hypothetical protein